MSTFKELCAPRVMHSQRNLLEKLPDDHHCLLQVNTAARCHRRLSAFPWS